ncbi:MAG: hypothetical protein JNJ86_02000 [Chitinophagaceae bacterium]|jgi:hypothetical protein|nr:hypothetical protein [Chitinophagaceae bacterium]
MKNKPSIWVVAGIGIGASVGVALDNIPAGVTLGAAIGILTMLVSFTTVEKKK